MSTSMESVADALERLGDGEPREAWGGQLVWYESSALSRLSILFHPPLVTADVMKVMLRLDLLGWLGAGAWDRDPLLVLESREGAGKSVWAQATWMDDAAYRGCRRYLESLSASEV